jgi:hypothetical protein
MHPLTAPSFPTGPAPIDSEFARAANAARTSLYWRGLARSIRAGMTVHNTTARRCDDVARSYEREVTLAARRAELSGADALHAQAGTSQPSPAPGADCYPFETTPAQAAGRAAMERAARCNALARWPQGLPATGRAAA